MSRDILDNKWIAEIVCAVCVFVGIGLCLFGLAELKQAAESSSWPTVTGTIVHAMPDSGSGYSLRYRYKIAGQKYAGTRVSFHRLTGKEQTQRVMNRYVEGEPVEVYYNPDDPESSVLEPGIRPGTYLFSGFGLFFAMAAVGFLWLDRRLRPRETEA